MVAILLWLVLPLRVVYQRDGCVLDADMMTPMPLIYNMLFLSISTFETLPGYQGRREDVYKPVESDYKVSHPTRIIKIAPDQ